MISHENEKKIDKSKENKFWLKSLPLIISTISFFISIYLQFKLNDDTALFVDKIIDLCSIFFGVFIGCLYLFEKFKSIETETYNLFLKFCKTSISLNIILISLSFVLIVFNPIFSDKIFYSSDFLYFITFKYSLKTIAFSIYFGVFSVSIYYLIRLLKIIFILLK